MAGEWSGCMKLCDILKGRIQGLTKAGAGDIEHEGNTSIADFMKSPLYQTEAEYQVLLSGFESNLPFIYTISISQGTPKIESKQNFGVIGWGSTIATVLLTLRESHSTMPLPYVAYLVYEAKRASEKTGYVGRFTALAIQAPGPSEIKDKAYLKIMSETGKAHLEVVYSGLWQVPFAKIPDLEDDFFIDPTAKRSPQ